MTVSDSAAWFSAICTLGGTITAIVFIYQNGKVLKEMQSQTKEQQRQNDFLTSPRLRLTLKELDRGSEELKGSIVGPERREAGLQELDNMEKKWGEHLAMASITVPDSPRAIYLEVSSKGERDIEQLSFAVSAEVQHHEAVRSNLKDNEKASGEVLLTMPLGESDGKKYIRLVDTTSFPVARIALTCVRYRAVGSVEFADYHGSTSLLSKESSNPTILPKNVQRGEIEEEEPGEVT